MHMHMHMHMAVWRLFLFAGYYKNPHGSKMPVRQTLNGSLPLEQGPYSRQTLSKRVSDHPRHFIFRRRKKKLTIFSAWKSVSWHFC